MDVLTVLGEMIRYLGEWVPRPRIVRSTEAGVRFWFGRWPKVVHPGWRLDWPALADMEIVPIVRQVVQLEAQTLFTGDAQTVIAGAVIVFSIEDVHKFLVENYDAEEGIVEVAGHVLRDVIVGKSLVQIQETDGRRSIDKALVGEATKALSLFGVKVETMRLTDFAPARVINLVGVNLSVSNGSDE